MLTRLHLWFLLRGRPAPCRAALFISCAALFLVNGCATRRNQSFQWPGVSVVRPRLPAASLTPIPDEPPPDLELAIPLPAILAHAAPSRPRAPAPAANGNESDPAGRAPAMAPQLTPAESAAERKKTEESLRVAEENLGRLSGRTLTSEQSEMSGKARDFLRLARQAAREKDWVRARTLAQKAQLLSEELLRSL